MLQSELGDEYVKGLNSHLSELKLAVGVVMSAQLGLANRGTAYVLHKAPLRGAQGTSVPAGPGQLQLQRPPARRQRPARRWPSCRPGA